MTLQEKLNKKYRNRKVGKRKRDIKAKKNKTCAFGYYPLRRNENT